MTDLDIRIAELEAISKQRPFTDAEIEEFCILIKHWRLQERMAKKKRLARLNTINRFLAARA